MRARCMQNIHNSSVHSRLSVVWSSRVVHSLLQRCPCASSAREQQHQYCGQHAPRQRATATCSPAGSAGCYSGRASISEAESSDAASANYGTCQAARAARFRRACVTLRSPSLSMLASGRSQPRKSVVKVILSERIGVLAFRHACNVAGERRSIDGSIYHAICDLSCDKSAALHWCARSITLL